MLHELCVMWGVLAVGIIDDAGGHLGPLFANAVLATDING